MSDRDSEKTAAATPVDLRGSWAVEPDSVRIWEDEMRVLYIEVDGEVYDDVHARYVFPISGKSDHVSFSTDKDNEVVLLKHPAGLDPESRRVLERSLHLLYFAAQIIKVDSISEAMGVSLWHVETDQGHARFEVVDRQRHIRLLPGGRYIITDADGNRFEIKNVFELDERSRKYIETET